MTIRDDGNKVIMDMAVHASAGHVATADAWCKQLDLPMLHADQTMRMWIMITLRFSLLFSCNSETNLVEEQRSTDVAYVTCVVGCRQNFPCSATLSLFLAECSAILWMPWNGTARAIPPSRYSRWGRRCPADPNTPDQCWMKQARGSRLGRWGRESF